MLSRVRLDAFGTTAAEVESILYDHAEHVEKLIGVSISRGEAVIERQLAEPDDGMFAWQGRLVLHLDVSAGIAAGTGTNSSSSSSVVWSGVSANAAT